MRRIFTEIYFGSSWRFHASRLLARSSLSLCAAHFTRRLDSLVNIHTCPNVPTRWGNYCHFEMSLILQFRHIIRKMLLCLARDDANEERDKGAKKMQSSSWLHLFQCHCWFESRVEYFDRSPHNIACHVKKLWVVCYCIDRPCLVSVVIRLNMSRKALHFSYLSSLHAVNVAHSFRLDIAA